MSKSDEFIESVFAYEEHAVVFDEIKTRPLNDIVSEIVELRTIVRSLVSTNGSTRTAIVASRRWHERWGSK